MPRAFEKYKMIYIIDDDRYVRRSFSLLLKSAGFESVSFEGAEQFLNQTRFSAEDLLILDYHMPGMNGCDLLNYFKEKEIHYPVIIITAYDDQESRECAKNYGAIAYLRKPVDGEALIDLVKYSLSHA